MSDWYPINREEHERCAGILAHTHVPLPLDVAQVPDAVVEQMLAVLFPYRHTVRGDHDLRVRDAIAALAQALGEVGE